MASSSGQPITVRAVVAVPAAVVCAVLVARLDDIALVTPTAAVRR